MNWNRLPRVVVDAQSLEACKARLDIAAGIMAVETEPPHHYFINIYSHVTDGSREDV